MVSSPPLKLQPEPEALAVALEPLGLSMLIATSAAKALPQHAAHRRAACKKRFMALVFSVFLFFYLKKVLRL
jgi:hypothetical protein